MPTQTATEGRTTDRKTVTVPVAPPRETAEYRTTTHFIDRLRERVDERDRDHLLRILIEDGQISRTRAGDDLADDVPADEVGATVAFTTTGPGDRPWTLIAALRPAAFVDEDERHRALTIWQGTPTREVTADE
jgi:hypothetical protein